LASCRPVPVPRRSVASTSSSTGDSVSREKSGTVHRSRSFYYAELIRNDSFDNFCSSSKNSLESLHPKTTAAPENSSFPSYDSCTTDSNSDFIMGDDNKASRHSKTEFGVDLCGGEEAGSRSSSVVLGDGEADQPLGAFTNSLNELTNLDCLVLGAADDHNSRSSKSSSMVPWQGSTESPLEEEETHHRLQTLTNLVPEDTMLDRVLRCFEAMHVLQSRDTLLSSWQKCQGEEEIAEKQEVEQLTQQYWQRHPGVDNWHPDLFFHDFSLEEEQFPESEVGSVSSAADHQRLCHNLSLSSVNSPTESMLPGYSQSTTPVDLQLASCIDLPTSSPSPVPENVVITPPEEFREEHEARCIPENTRASPDQQGIKGAFRLMTECEYRRSMQGDTTQQTVDLSKAIYTGFGHTRGVAALTTTSPECSLTNLEHPSRALYLRGLLATNATELSHQTTNTCQQSTSSLHHMTAASFSSAANLSHQSTNPSYPSSSLSHEVTSLPHQSTDQSKERETDVGSPKNEDSRIVAPDKELPMKLSNSKISEVSVCGSIITNVIKTNANKCIIEILDNNVQLGGQTTDALRRKTENSVHTSSSHTGKSESNVIDTQTGTSASGVKKTMTSNNSSTEEEVLTSTESDHNSCSTGSPPPVNFTTHPLSPENIITTESSGAVADVEICEKKPSLITGKDEVREAIVNVKECERKPKVHFAPSLYSSSPYSCKPSSLPTQSENRFPLHKMYPDSDSDSDDDTSFIQADEKTPGLSLESNKSEEVELFLNNPEPMVISRVSSEYFSKTADLSMEASGTGSCISQGERDLTLCGLVVEASSPGASSLSSPVTDGWGVGAGPSVCEELLSLESEQFVELLATLVNDDYPKTTTTTTSTHSHDLVTTTTTNQSTGASMKNDPTTIHTKDDLRNLILKDNPVHRPSKDSSSVAGGDEEVSVAADCKDAFVSIHFEEESGTTYSEDEMTSSTQSKDDYTTTHSKDDYTTTHSKDDYSTQSKDDYTTTHSKDDYTTTHSKDDYSTQSKDDSTATHSKDDSTTTHSKDDYTTTHSKDDYSTQSKDDSTTTHSKEESYLSSYLKADLVKTDSKDKDSGNTTQDDDSLNDHCRDDSSPTKDECVTRFFRDGFVTIDLGHGSANTLIKDDTATTVNKKNSATTVNNKNSATTVNKRTSATTACKTISATTLFKNLSATNVFKDDTANIICKSVSTTTADNKTPATIQRRGVVVSASQQDNNSSVWRSGMYAGASSSSSSSSSSAASSPSALAADTLWSSGGQELEIFHPCGNTGRSVACSRTGNIDPSTQRTGVARAWAGYTGVKGVAEESYLAVCELGGDEGGGSGGVNKVHQHRHPFSVANSWRPLRGSITDDGGDSEGDDGDGGGSRNNDPSRKYRVLESSSGRDNPNGGHILEEVEGERCRNVLGTFNFREREGSRGSVALSTRPLLGEAGDEDNSVGEKTVLGPFNFQQHEKPSTNLAVRTQDPASPCNSPGSCHGGASVLATFNFQQRQNTTNLAVKSGRHDLPDSLRASPVGGHSGTTVLGTFNFVGRNDSLQAAVLKKQMPPEDELPSLSDSITSLEDGKHLVGVYNFTQPRPTQHNAATSQSLVAGSQSQMEGHRPQGRGSYVHSDGTRRDTPTSRRESDSCDAQTNVTKSASASSVDEWSPSPSVSCDGDHNNYSYQPQQLVQVTDSTGELVYSSDRFQSIEIVCSKTHMDSDSMTLEDSSQCPSGPESRESTGEDLLDDPRLQEDPDTQQHTDVSHLHPDVSHPAPDVSHLPSVSHLHHLCHTCIICVTLAPDVSPAPDVTPAPDVSHLHHLCHTCIICVTPASSVSHLHQMSHLHHLCHTCTRCVTPAPSVSHLHHLCHTCIICVTLAPDVSHLHHLCHTCTICVTPAPDVSQLTDTLTIISHVPGTLERV
ncbi:hypothetical protein Hamer_G008332, partial [Homarus americanus]